MSKRVILAGLSHETHTFLTGITELSDFRIQQGDALLQCEGDSSTMAGMVETGHACDWEMIPIVSMNATPSAIVSDRVIESFWEHFLLVIQRESPQGIDGILLDMHGAMVSETLLDVEGELLRRIRRLDGLADVPLCVCLDLHGNITPLMAECANGMIAYRNNPHTDVKETAVRVALLLDRLMTTGERAVTVYEHPPIVWVPSGTGTADEPMRSLEARARDIEQAQPHILAVSVFGGFAFADIPETGVSFTAVTLGNPEIARQELRELSQIALNLKEQGNPRGVSLSKAMEQIATHKEGLLLLVEPADNIGGGSPGDLTCVLRALVEAEISHAAVCLNDPDAVKALWDVERGEHRHLSLGGRSGQIGAEPIALHVEVLSRSNGTYFLEDSHSHNAGSGLQQEMGPCVVVKTLSSRPECSGVLILLTSRKTPPFDLGQWRSQGIEPETLAVIGVKAAVAHKQAYDPIARHSIRLDTLGPCTEKLQQLPYQKIRRPIFPLDSLLTAEDNSP